MPIIPPILTAPYPNLSDILNLVRVRVNDAIQSLGGEIITDVQPFTQIMANAGWHTLQEFLANLGYTRSKQEVILSGIPAVTSFDPSVQASLAWNGYFNGTGYQIPPDAPALPQDMILPLRLWERCTSGNGFFFPMTQVLDGLPDGPKLPANGCWDWREDAIYLPGATLVTDIRMRYAGYLPDFTDQGDTSWYDLPVPIMRCENALAYYIAAEASGPRADLDAGTFRQMGDDAARKIFNKEVQQKQRTTATRRPYGRRNTCSYNSYGN